MKGAYKALRKGGVFVADAPNPYRAERWIKNIPVIWRVDDEKINILILDSVAMNTVSGIIDWKGTIILNEGGGLKMLSDFHKLRAYSANELRLFAKIAGFKKIKMYGDWRRNQEPRDAHRLILVAVKT